MWDLYIKYLILTHLTRILFYFEITDIKILKIQEHFINMLWSNN